MAFGRRGRYFIVLGQEIKNSIQALFEEILVQVFGSAGQKQVNFDQMTLGQELGRLLGFKLQIVGAGADFNLERFQLLANRLLLGPFLLFVLKVKEFAIIHDFGHRRGGARRDFNQIKLCLSGPVQRLAQRDYPQVAAILGDDAQFRGANLLVDAEIFAHWRLQL